MSGVRDPNNAILLSCAVTGANFVFTFIPTATVERMGRRVLLLLSTFCMQFVLFTS